MRSRLSLAVAATVVLITASPALADTSYVVNGPAPDGPGACTPLVTGVETCTTLRGAVNAANALPDTDSITVAAGTYELDAPLTLSASVSIVGASARTTTIQANGTRAFVVNPGVTATMALMTVAGGNAGSLDGGNIFNQGTVQLTWMRLTGGTAARGAGLANVGNNASADVLVSLIDHNTGSGVANAGATSPAELTMYASTVALNSGPGVTTGFNGGDSLTVYLSTIGRNGGTGLAVNTGTTDIFGTIVASNSPNCSGPVTNSGGNLEDGTSCGFGPARDPLLSAQLENKGGETDVLSIPANSPAVNIVQPCLYSIDQRGETRVTDISQPCDAGAFEESIVIDQPPPPPPPPGPAPTATPVPTPTPVAGKAVAGKAVEGKVRVKKPGGRFEDLDPSKPIPLGSTIDTKDGTIELTAQQTAGGKTQKATFHDGIFKVTQTRTTTDLTLNEALARCPKRGKASAAAKKPKSRKLWGNGSGSFRTRGQYSSATVRGTEWLVQDSCSGTLTRVKSGVVSVRDQVKRKTVVLRAGKKYLAKPKK
jgi:hypothetical protein